MRASDPRAREILERTEALTPEELMRLHGAVRDLGWRDERAARLLGGAGAARAATAVTVGRRRGAGAAAACVLRPRAGGDVFDRALAGRVAMVEAIQQDIDGDVQLAVTSRTTRGATSASAASPGTGSSSRPTRSSRWPATPAPRRRAVLVAGIGNMFLGDDGFGVAVARPARAARAAAGVEVVDFGIRGMDLAYALGEGWDAALLSTPCRAARPPGTLSLIEPERRAGRAGGARRARHGPGEGARARRASSAACPPRMLVVGCEPLTRMTGDEEEVVGELSEPVRAALDAAERLVATLLEDLDGQRRRTRP